MSDEGKQLILNPVFGMLHNVKENRWHPILFRESPLPGPDRPDKPVRLKSVGHHTAGFPTREEAIADTEDKAPKGIAPTPRYDWTKDIPWDGEGIPTDVRFLLDSPDGCRLV